jgi:hypothetical protein
VIKRCGFSSFSAVDRVACLEGREAEEEGKRRTGEAGGGNDGSSERMT